ncbi:glutamine amidotransferase subunit [Elasticomyces elasticus]|nr:glutamine amidotransferase subunit [Elasticomyces elasticus]KAK3668062.1 glutamine amidotransferase subunit [Elasticomyces elasticus]KAK4894485.1 glutamine amidotransferase subunit [Elasticomyces elasticus]KAK4925210.1 glutamine amidotransferase subunit [Elasticomyces elasticus]KAK5767702.1 glutamine amidotransferase subunit [Elasticomyces elasticus]
MCRFLIYSGHSPILLSHLITSPTHSILTQSYDSRLRLDQTRPHNGDGFGVGYYPTAPSARRRTTSDADEKVESRRQQEDVIDLGPEPCIFTSTIPAWNCKNLERLASKTISPLVFAHVRASTEGALADSNCHPFSRGALMWMHNGGIGGWKMGVKRKLVAEVNDRWFEGVGGSTDSEWAFALFMDSLERLGVDADDEVKQRDGFGHTALRKAMLMTIDRINGFRKSLPEAVRQSSDTRSLLNFAVTDGKSVVCTRYVSSKTDEAASLFFSSGTSWREQPSTLGSRTPKIGKGEYKMERRDKGADIVLIASEPLTFERDNWVTVPTNSVLTIHNQTVLIHPILDEYYNHTPSFTRSSRFAVEKGQTIGDGMAEKKSTKAAMVRDSSMDDLASGTAGVALAVG